MSGSVRITLRPMGAAFDVPRGSPLQEVLFPYGVEFPCGGRARCKGCRVRVLEGSIPVTAEQARILSRSELDAGWRLACHCLAEDDLTLELAQWEAAILSDEAPFSFTPRSGLGVAIDVGTTTLVAQLLDLRTADVLAVTTALNAQAKHGADVMSRVGYAVNEKKQEVLTRAIRTQTGAMIEDLLRRGKAGADALTDVVLVGNTVMHHLFCGIDCTPLSHYPFEPEQDGMIAFSPGDLGWKSGGRIRFLPCLGGFVGSDILAGVLAVNLHRSDTPLCLIDLGTNGEIVIGSKRGLLCCSTAAGPAFEGARISMGMRAATGAIAEVAPGEGGGFACKTLGDVRPRGICGSGLVDAAAVLLDAGRITSGGRFTNREESIMLAEPVALTQTDVRELQLAKGAIAAGVRILLAKSGLTGDDIARVYLAGAFGNYVNTASARTIGLVNFPSEKVVPSGNTALRGAKRALFDEPGAYDALAGSVRHIALDSDGDFQDVYVEEMGFPSGSRQ
ncbi:MAG TPA: ASKHA domain-containing protein [Bacteroidota bacterium]|nr:ASKHA domain-containing protein [Bacteroidota bacterium]